jgi:hypothetical protein
MKKGALSTFGYCKKSSAATLLPVQEVRFLSSKDYPSF